MRRHRRRPLRAGQHRGRRGAVDLDAVHPGDPRRLARAVHREPRDGVLHEPGGGRGDCAPAGLPGSIVSISSISGMNTAPFHIAYGTAKAAVVAMTRTMAVELALDDIRVNAVAPGVTETAASAHLRRRRPRPRPDRRSRWAAAGTPEEQAGAILFLLSDLSSYITGQTLLVDGGLNLNGRHLGADNTSLFLKDESFRSSDQADLGDDPMTDIESSRAGRLEGSRRGSVRPDDHRRRGLHLRGVRPRRAGQAVAQGVAAGRPRRGDPRGRQLPDLRHPRRLDHRRAHRTGTSSRRTTTSACTAAAGWSTPPTAPRTRAAGRASRSCADSTAGHTVWTARAPTSASRTTGRAR